MLDHDPQPGSDLGQHRLPVGMCRWRWLLDPDRAQQHRGDEVGHRVDGDRERSGQGLDQEARRAEREELRYRTRRGQRAVRLDELGARDDRRQVRAVGHVEERRQQRGQQRDDEQLRQRQGPGDRGHWDAAQEQRTSEIGPDHHGSTSQPVHPGAGDQPNRQPGGEIHGAHQRDLDRSRAQHVDRDQGQRQAGEQAAEDRDRRCRPQTGECPVAPQRAPRQLVGRRQQGIKDGLEGLDAHRRRVAAATPPGQPVGRIRGDHASHPEGRQAGS